MKRLFVSVLALILLQACTTQKRTPLSADLIKQIEMLPSESQVIGYINVHQILNSPVYELLKKDADIDPFEHESYQEFIKSTGFDLRENMKEMVFAGEISPGNHSQGMFVAHGSFNPDKIENYIRDNTKDSELTSATYGEFRLLSTGNENFVFCFADSNHLVAGASVQVKTWLDIFSGQEKSNPVQGNLLTRIESLQSRHSMWIIMDAGVMIESAEREGIGFARGLKNVRFTDFSMTMSESLQLFSQINCSDNEKAKLVYDALRGFVSSAKLSVSDDRDTVDILNKIDFRVHDLNVTGQVTLDQEEIRKLLDQQDRLRSVESV